MREGLRRSTHLEQQLAPYAATDGAGRDGQEKGPVRQPIEGHVELERRRAPGTKRRGIEVETLGEHHGILRISDFG